MLPTLSKQQYQLALQLIGHAFFWVLIAWSILFYKERMMNFDSAYYCFNILRTGEFFLPHDRTINYASQWLPLLAMQMGCSLKTFLMVYSASFIALHYLMYNLIVYGFRNAETGIFLALCMCLTTRYKFYSGISEIYFSLVLAALFVAWLSKNRSLFPKLSNIQHVLIACLITLVCTTAHPIIVLPMLAFLGFDWFYHKRWFDGWNWSIIAFVLAAFSYRYWAIKSSSYEGNRLGNAWEQFEAIYTPTEFRSWHIIKYFLETEYTLAAAVFIILVGILFWQRKILSGLFLLLCTVLLALLVFVTYSYLTSDTYFMIDGYLGLIGIVWAIPILFVVLKSERYWWSILLSVGLLGFSLQRTYSKHTFFKERLEYLTYLMDNNGDAEHRKLTMQVQTFDWSKTWLRWAIPYETLLLSSVESPDSTKTVYIADWDADMEKILSISDKLHDEMHPISSLPRLYFKLDTNEYVKITDAPAKTKK